MIKMLEGGGIMLKIVLFVLFTLLFTGCQNGSQSSDSGSSSGTNNLTILRAPTSSDIIATNQQIVLEFSAELDTATVNTGTIYIMRENGEGGSFVNCAITTDGAKVTITPYQYFQSSSSFTLSVTKAVKDVSGRTLSDIYTYTFTTSNDPLDTSALNLIRTKPALGNTDTLVQSDIVLNFNKNLSSEPEHTGVNTIKVVNEANSSQISGKISVFNSLLRFEPDSPLPYDANISVSLVSSVADLYGTRNYSYSKSWFKTKTQTSNPVTNQGFNSLGSYDIGDRSSIVRKLSDGTNSSKIIVATSNGLELFEVVYNAYPEKPTLKHLGSYKLLHIQSMMTIGGKFIIAGITNKGIYSFQVEGNTTTEISHIDSNKPVYGLNYGYNYQTSMIDKIYAVGPQYGLKVFDFNSTTGVITLAQSVDTNNTAYLDVMQAKGYNAVSDTDVKRVYVADYYGGIDIYDENGTKLSRIDVNGSVKKLALKQDYYGSVQGVYSISSSGKIDQYDLNGSRSLYSNVPDLLGSISDVRSYNNSSNMYSGLFYSELGKGVYIVNDTNPVGIVDINKTIVSADVVQGYSSKPFLVTLSQEGQLNIFNAKKDTNNPTFSSSPYEGTTGVDANTSIKIEFSDDYFDNASISTGSFSIVDNNTSNSVDFNLSAGYNSYSYVVHTLQPSVPLTSQHRYTVTIEGNVSDMIGNKLNDGNSSTFSFTIN